MLGLDSRQNIAFRRHRVAYCSLWILMLASFMAVFSEWIANSHPLLLNHQGKWYFPIFKKINPQVLGVDGIFIDYRLLEKQNPKDIMLWPPVRWGPYESDSTLEYLPAAPSASHLFGSDDRGRDVAARLLYGFRNSLCFAISVWMISYILGILIGAVQGYWGGNIDFFFQRAIEVFNGVPYLFLLIILVSILKPNMWLFIAINSLFAWIGISYYVRVEFLRLRKLEFTEAARALGVPWPRLFFKHYLPNTLTPIITFSPFALTSNITALAGLDYLGFGLAAPAASWGELLNQAMKYFDHAWWLALYPSLALAGTLLLLNFVGEGLRSALDPKGI